MADQVLAFAAIGVCEVRCYPYPADVATIEAMAPVVAAVHAG